MANRAGTVALTSNLVAVTKLLDAYFDVEPDLSDPAQRVAFGTSGHRGSSLKSSFNEVHIAAITQAIVEYRRAQGTDGPVFLAKDTHGLSEPAWTTAIEVLAGNDVAFLIDSRDGYTPTPAVSHAILRLNRLAGVTGGAGAADGIVVTPSHNPPRDGGFKYNPPNGGPADTDVTRWIQDEANRILEASGNDGIDGIKRVSDVDAHVGATPYDFMGIYVADLDAVIDMVVRVVLSHVMQPSASPADTADDVSWIASRIPSR